MDYNVKAVQNSKHYATIHSLRHELHELDTIIKTRGCWHDPIKGCFRVTIFKVARMPRHITLHFRIDATPGNTPTIWLW